MNMNVNGGRGLIDMAQKGYESIIPDHGEVDGCTG